MAKKKSKITLEDLLEAGCHFGHQAKRWNPKMKDYIWTVRDGVHIFDLVKTKEGLEKAADFAKEIAKQGGKIIFVGTKRQAKGIIKDEAVRCGMPYINQRWLGGTITNWQQIKKSVDKLAELKEKKEKGEYEKYTKKERLLIDREIARLERFFGGLLGVEELPEAIFVVDTKREKTAVREANRKGVKIIGIVDSNADPEKIDFVIPSNDDAVGAIKLVASRIADAVIEGKRLGEKNEKS